MASTEFDSWVTFEDAHVADFATPPVRGRRARRSSRMLLTRTRCGARREGGRPALSRLFAAALTEEQSWFAKHRWCRIHHMVVVSETLSNDSRRRCGSCQAAGERARRWRRRPPWRGFNARRNAPLAGLIVQYTAQQGLIARAFAVDECLTI